jgi:pimeloyl-ACP methyl ester carboxylesterase
MEQRKASSRSRHKGRYRCWMLLPILLIYSACSPPLSAVTVSPTPSHSPTAPSILSYKPIFESAPCAFPVPSGYNPECGYLIVPENRARPDSGTIRLHVGIFRSRSASPYPDPVVKLSGGPGSSGLNLAGYLLEHGADTVLDERDFIVFDQRGSGYSRPRLDCPERDAITPLLLSGRLSAEESQQAIVDAFHRCHERLTAEGIDLSAYNSAASAADLNDLRQALGYEKLNLYAVSYGTRLALTMMRDYPNAVRSAVLDSAYPLEVNVYVTMASNVERAFNVFFDRCAAETSCNALYPDLRNVFYELVDRLNAQPIWISLLTIDTRQTVRVDGGLLIDVLFLGLHDPAVTASMPQMIYEVRKGNYTILKERLALYFDTAGALGTNMAVQCAEEIPFSTMEDVYQAAQHVQPQIATYYSNSVRPMFSVCKEWASAPLDSRENLPVFSDVPTLILAGEQDPITPPEWGRMVEQDLSNSYFHEFPESGHWVARSSPCAILMALAFWNDPTSDPAAICQ